MSNLRTVVQLLVNGAELAADEQFLGEDHHELDDKDLLVQYYELSMQRANAILDRNKDRYFNEVLNLTNRGDMERALRTYDRSYLLSLPLSLESIGELAKSLIQMSYRYKTQPSSAWKDVAAMNIDMEPPARATNYPRKLADI